MARAGLGSDWTCLFANDFDLKKGDTYRLNWGVGEPKVCPELKVCDVREVNAVDLPDIPISFGAPSRARTFPWQAAAQA